MAKPKTIVGHRDQLHQLEHDLATHNVSHAYLFSGPAHLGKMTVAHRFARDLLTYGIAEERRAEVMHMADNLVHPDFLVLDKLWIESECDDWDTIANFSNVPQIHRSKAPTAKTDTISIEDIRALQERLIDTGSGTYRAVVIRSIERMNDSAANAFLKILEEPPEGLVFILTTQHQDALLPTIISRTRVMPFQTVSRSDMLQVLDGLSDDDKHFILHLSSGAPGFAISLRDDPELLRGHRTVHGIAQSFWRSHSLSERLQILEPLKKRTQEADTFLLHLGLTLREQSPDVVCNFADAYQALVRAWHTNTHKQLLSQHFALQLQSV